MEEIIMSKCFLRMLFFIISIPLSVSASNILIVNDDSISPGVNALYNTFKHDPNNNVLVVVPDTNNSGVGTKITTPDSSKCARTRYPIRCQNITVKEIKKHYYTISGTPVDAVNFGIKNYSRLIGISSLSPDIVISGINEGMNIGMPLIRASGTVSAALKAASKGYIAIAVSNGLSRGRSVEGSDKIIANYIKNYISKSRYILKYLAKYHFISNINFPYGWFENQEQIIKKRVKVNKVSNYTFDIMSDGLDSNNYYLYISKLDCEKNKLCKRNTDVYYSLEDKYATISYLGGENNDDEQKIKVF